MFENPEKARGAQQSKKVKGGWRTESRVQITFSPWTMQRTGLY